MSNLVVIGGFTESKALLDPVAIEAVNQGFGYDAEVLTLSAAAKMDEERLRSLMAGATVLTHAAGLTVVPDVRTHGPASELPEDLIAVAAPERSSVNDLRAAAKRKTELHIFGKTDYPRRAHLRVVAGNTAELVAHIPTNRSLPKPISGFSTMRKLSSGHLNAEGRLGSFTMSHDVFYSNQEWRNSIAFEELVLAGCVLEELPGTHDELLLNPGGVLRGITEAFERAEAAPQL